MADSDFSDSPNYYDMEDSDSEGPGSSHSTRFIQRDEPIPLLTYDEELREYVMGQEAFDFFKSLSGPIGVIAVAGLYRTGKSYLLNRMLLDRTAGFGVGPTINPCTKGMWVWGRAIPGTMANGDPCSVLIMDTEGLGALDEDSNHDCRIFSLAVLISSSFIYNSVGSIDENALQSLSLVVNLTQHIHIKSKGNVDADCEDYAAYFPNFTWIVRDFVLQLIDMDGESISPKEYLERALQPQKGYSDSTEEKNRIRRLLKNFFKDRDCITLVRPTTDEEDLQNLASKPFESLRAEFQEQVLILRQKMLGRVRPKQMNGKNLTGEMYASLVESYIKAVNSGIVPNIENAWTYICQGECKKAYQEAMSKYDRILLGSVQHRLPISEEELKLLHKEAKEAAFDHFELKAVGDEKDGYQRDLQVNIAQKIANLKSENEDEAEKACKAFLEENYKSLDGKLKSGEFTHFLEFEKQLRNFEEFFMHHGPQGPRRAEIMMSFLTSKTNDASDHFIKQVSNELKITQEMSAEHLTKLEADMRKLKEEHLKEKDELQRRTTATESEKAELVAKERSLTEQLEILKQEHEKTQQKLKQATGEVKELTKKTAEDTETKISEYEDKFKTMERKLYQSEADWAQEKALLEQKISFQERTISDLSSRDTAYSSELQDYKKEHEQTTKDTYARYEAQIKSYAQRLEAANEKVMALERNLADKESEFDRSKMNWMHEKDTLERKIKDVAMDYSQVKGLLESKEGQSKQTLEQLAGEHEQTAVKLRARLDETEKKLRQTEDTLAQDHKQWEKDNAIMVQKIEFQETTIEELNKTIQDGRKQQDRMVLAMQEADNEEKLREQLEEQLQYIKENHSNELRSIEQEAEQNRRKLQAELDAVTNAKNEAELKLKLDTNDRNYEIKQLKDKLQVTEDDRKAMAARLEAIERERNDLKDSADNRMRYKSSEMENLIEDIQNKAHQEIQEVNKRAEESFTQLKEYHELEKQRLEQRMKEEKDRSDKKYNAAVEEHERILNEERDALNNDLDNLEADYADLERDTSEQISALQSQATLDAQKIETLEKYLKETKENLSSVHSSHSSTLEQSLESFNKERGVMLEKIEKMAADMANKDKELTTIKYQTEQAENTIASRDKEIEELQEDLKASKSGLAEKLEETKQKLSATTDELMQIQSDQKREAALAQQQSEFMTKKIQDLERTNEESTKRYTEKIKTIKEELVTEYQETVEKLTKEKEQLETKHSEKRNQYRDSQAEWTQQVNNLEKASAIFKEKVATLTQKKTEIEERHAKEVEDLSQQISVLKEKEGAGAAALQAELDTLKTRNAEMDKEISEKNSQYERDKTLWENKFNFLVQQRDQSRTELSESQKKFEQTLEQLQKRGDKSNLEQTAQSLVASVESKYTKQISDMQEHHNSQISELTEKLRNSEAEYRIVKEELELERRGRSTDSGSLEKRLADYQKQEQQFKDEINGLKVSKDQKLNELARQYENEKEQLKVKIGELEKRSKDAENNRGQLFLEHEKERAKWNLERDHLIAQKNDAQDMVEQLDKRKEALLRENEKYKTAERTGTRRLTGRREGGPPRPNALGSTQMSFEDFTKVKESGGSSTNSSFNMGMGAKSSRSVRSFTRNRSRSPMAKSKASNEESKFSDN